jgi:hypothetical protein
MITEKFITLMINENTPGIESYEFPHDHEAGA